MSESDRHHAPLGAATPEGDHQARGGGTVPPPPPAGGTDRQPPAPPPYVPTPHPSGLPSDVRTWGMAAHLSALVGLFLGGIPAFVGPLVVWLVKRDDHPFIDHHGKEALNFNLTMLLLLAAGIVGAIVTLGIGLIVILPAGLVIAVAYLVLSIMAAVKASNGEGYRYPLTIRFIS